MYIIACSDCIVLIRSDNLHKYQIYKEKTVFGGYAEKVAIMLFVNYLFLIVSIIVPKLLQYCTEEIKE